VDGLAMIDVVRVRRDWLSKDINGVWRVMLYRQKNGNSVYVAIPNQAGEVVLAVPPMRHAKTSFPRWPTHMPAFVEDKGRRYMHRM